jgi:hypothetical protein
MAYREIVAMMSHEEVTHRLNRLVDPQCFRDDAQYVAQVHIFRNWLIQAEMAMEDEGVDHAVARRVINRMVFGCPNGADSQERMQREQQVLEMIRNTPRMGRIT